MWAETEREMITEDGNVRRYINSNIIDKFDLWDCADLPFPNGYNKGGRVFKGYAPTVTVLTAKYLITKTMNKVKQIGNISPTSTRDNPNQGRVYDDSGLSPALSTMGGGGRQPMILEPIAIDEQNKTIREDGTVGTVMADGSSPKKNNRVMQTDMRIRKLTPLECWRLQGQTDEAFYKAQKVNSDSQLYKQAGNSICVDVLFYLMKAVFEQNE